MQVDVQWFDPTPYLDAKTRPVFVLPRPDSGSDQPVPWSGKTERAKCGEFWVPTTDLTSEDISWAVTRIGDFVSVPVHAYRTARSAAALWAFAVQLGMTAAADLAAKHGLTPVSATIIAGTLVTDLSTGEGLRAYLGIALRTK